MLGKLWAWALKQWAEEVPDEISACINCGAIQCSDDRFQNCPRRVAEAAALKTMRETTRPREAATK